MQQEPSSEVVARLSSLLEEEPIQFEITILPGTSSSSDNDDGGSGDSSQTNNTKLSLEESLLLVEGRYLGLDARSLPWMTQEIREAYKRQKKRLLLLVEHDSAVTNNDHGRQEDPPRDGTVPSSSSSSSSSSKVTMMIQTLACLLLVNPDHATAWADRRRCLLQIAKHRQQLMEDEDRSLSSVALWKKELAFVNLLMTQHSKAPFSWAHRKYVLQQILDKGAKDEDTILSLFKEEVRVCREVAERYPKNYYAWTHRRFFLGKVVMDDSTTTTTAIDSKQQIDLLQEEWDDIVTRWLVLHVSDHSAAHYASQVLKLWTTKLLLQSSTIDERNVLESLAAKVLNQVRSLIERRHESHETLWILRRMAVRILWQTRESSIKALVREDVTSVAAIYLEKSDDVHAWTFLAWVDRVMEQDEDDTMDASSTLAETTDVPSTKADPQKSAPLAVRSLLRDHPQIHHFMWMEGH